MDYLTLHEQTAQDDESQPTLREPAELTAILEGKDFRLLGNDTAMIWLCSKAIRACDTENEVAYVYTQVRALFPLIRLTAQEAIQSVACDTLRMIRWRAERDKAILVRPQPKGENYNGIPI